MGIVQSIPFQMRRSELTPHDHQNILPRRTFLQGLAGASVEALLCYDAMILALTAQTSHRRCTQLGLRFRLRPPHGAVLDKWTPIGDGSNFQLEPNHGPARALQQQLVIVTGLANKAAESQGDGGGDHASQRTFVLERRPPEEDRRRRRPCRHYGRSNRRAAHQPGHAAAVARTRHRRHRPGRSLRRGLQLCLHELLTLALPLASPGPWRSTPA